MAAPFGPPQETHADMPPAPAPAHWPLFHIAPVLLALLASGAAASIQPGAQEIAERRTDLGELREKIDAVRKDLAAAETSRADVTDQLRESEREISALRRTQSELSRKQQKLERESRDLRRQQNALGEKIDEQQRQVAVLFRRQYLNGDSDPIKRLFSGQSPQQASRDLVYLAAIADARRALAATLAEQRREAEHLGERITAQAAELAEVVAENQRQQATMDSQRAARQKLLDRIAREVAARRKEIGTLQRDEQRLSNLITRLGKLLTARPKLTPKPPVVLPGEGRPPPTGPATGPLPERRQGGGPFADLRGRLRLPVAGTIAHRYGTPREGGQWKGLFIRSSAGSEIRAVAAGRVVFADWMRGFGNLLILDHGDDYLSIYGHNEALLLQVGENVAAGDPVASVGSTGGRGETGLYFELRHRGQPIDPLAWVGPR